MGPGQNFLVGPLLFADSKHTNNILVNSVSCNWLPIYILYCSGSQTFLKFRLYGPRKDFSITHGPLFLSINFLAKSREEQKKTSRPQTSNYRAKPSEEQKKVITPADVQSSTIQCDDLSKIRDLFAVPLKLLRGPEGDRGPQFENHCFIAKKR